MQTPDFSNNFEKLKDGITNSYLVCFNILCWELLLNWEYNYYILNSL